MKSSSISTLASHIALHIPHFFSLASHITLHIPNFFTSILRFLAKMVTSTVTHPETNPHFIRPLLQRQGPHSQSPLSPVVSPPQHQSQPDLPPLPRGTKQHQGQRSKPKGPRGKERESDYPFQAPRKDSASRQPQQPHVHPQYPPLHPYDSRHDGEFRSPWVIPPRHPSEDQRVHDPRRDGKYHSPWVLPPRHRDEDLHGPQLAQKKPQDQHPQQLDGMRMTSPQPRDHDREHEGDHYPLHPRDSKPPPKQDDHYPLHPRDSKPPPTQGRSRHTHGLRAPAPQRTKAITWVGAVLCAIFWIVIFLGGLIVLILYLVYRPRSPLFEVSSANLNAAYVDAGSLLNADISILANFTNPNKKASVDFNHMIIDLYYGTTLIGTQYIESFSAARTESRFANIHMITSQVRLPSGESLQLQNQTGRNAILFNIKGVFRVHSNLGSFLRYSYRLYGHCTIMVAAPPTGALRATRCRTKR